MKINTLLIAGLLCTFFLTACENNNGSENYPAETGSSAFESVSAVSDIVSDEEQQSTVTAEDMSSSESVSAVSVIVSDDEQQSTVTAKYMPSSESISEDTDTPINDTLFGDILPQTDMLRFFIQDNLYGDTLIRFSETAESSVKQEILGSISDAPIEKADDWSANMMTLPVYGFYAYDEDGSIIFAASWSNGFWIDSVGTAYRLNYDFSALETAYDWEAYGYYGNGYVSSMPCGYYFCFDENGWIKDNIPKRLPFYPVSAPENVTVEYIGFDGGGISLLMTNNRESNFYFLNYFQIEVMLDDEWYVVPTIPGNWSFSEIRSKIPAGTSEEVIYPLERYGDLPTGNYRIVGDEFYVEFTI